MLGEFKLQSIGGQTGTDKRAFYQRKETRIVDVGGGNINANKRFRVDTDLPPTMDVMASLFENKGRKRHDQPVALGEIDKLAREQGPQSRVRPTQQSFGTDHAVVSESDDRLIFEEELAAVDSRAHCRG